MTSRRRFVSFFFSYHFRFFYYYYYFFIQEEVKYTYTQTHTDTQTQTQTQNEWIKMFQSFRNWCTIATFLSLFLFFSLSLFHFLVFLLITITIHDDEKTTMLSENCKFHFPSRPFLMPSFCVSKWYVIRYKYTEEKEKPSLTFNWIQWHRVHRHLPSICISAVEYDQYLVDYFSRGLNWSELRVWKGPQSVPIALNSRRFSLSSWRRVLN